MRTDLAGKLALVTGAGSGIGQAIAVALAACGASVAATDINEDGAGATAALVRDAGGTASVHRLDVADPRDVARVAAELSRAGQTVSILVNNAGWEKVEPFAESAPDDWRAGIEINLLGAARVTHALLPAMIAAGKGGRIISISSDAGRVGSPGEVMYSASKAGLVGFSKALARETMKHGITVNCVSPGPVDTPFFHALPEATRAMLTKAIPARRLARPQEVAAAVVYFASDEAGYVTGQVLSVSGGLTMVG